MKPLTKEERAQLECDIEGGGSLLDLRLLAHIDKLIAAEAYWREQVRDSRMNHIYDERSICDWCTGQVPQYTEMIHEPDCPWLLAQEKP